MQKSKIIININYIVRYNIIMIKSESVSHE
jgi:hypothetical protein